MTEKSVYSGGALPQNIRLVGVGNARELGGYPAADGSIVKRGVLLRTAALSRATKKDLQRLHEVYHLAKIIDLRTTGEAVYAQDPEIPGAAHIHLRIVDEKYLDWKQKSAKPEDIAGLDLTKPANQIRLAVKIGIVGPQMYIGLISREQGRRGYAQMFEEALKLPEGHALLFHCTQGKDRTGLAAMLLLSALGVNEQIILADYELTNAYNAALIAYERSMLMATGIKGAELETYLRAMDEVDPRYMINALNWMKEHYGSAMGYIHEALGIDKSKVRRLRERYLVRQDACATSA